MMPRTKQMPEGGHPELPRGQQSSPSNPKAIGMPDKEPRPGMSPATVEENNEPGGKGTY